MFTPESYPGNWVLRYKNSFPAKVAQRDGPEVRSIGCVTFPSDWAVPVGPFVFTCFFTDYLVLARK